LGRSNRRVAIDKSAISPDWARSSYENQKPNSTFLKFDNFKGTPVFDSTIKAIYAKKGVAISAFTPIVATGGTKAFSAIGLPPGITINAATGSIQGSTIVTGTTSFTVSVQGLDANGDSKTTSQVYTLEVSDPDGFPNKLNMTFPGYTGSSTLSNFPVLIELHEEH
jgi:hypothetical protein